MTINVVCRRDAINRNRLAPLALVFTHDRRRKFVGLGISEALVHWDFDKQQPTADCPDRAEIQFQITSKIREYEKKIKKLEVLEIPVTFDTLFEQNGKRINCTVGEYFKQIIERLEKVEKYSSASKHKVTLVLVSQFRSVNMRFDELDLTYLREFEIFLSQKGNVNNSCNYAAFQYCRLYLIEILHQTTTHCKCIQFTLCCILSKFYIKPQHLSQMIGPSSVVSYRNSTSNHNRIRLRFSERIVVSYRNSTSNHNKNNGATAIKMLYLIEILHQTTTLISVSSFSTSCILSKFYIKPQLPVALLRYVVVVSYRNSTSNHNSGTTTPNSALVVSYRNSTSNHNSVIINLFSTPVVSYRNSTSNHNNGCVFSCDGLLYLIEILHQTTTVTATAPDVRRCILSKFYIKPQLPVALLRYVVVVSYRNSTSNHNGLAAIPSGRMLYLIEILHQTTTPAALQLLLVVLYLIEILHQTTTVDVHEFHEVRCILSKFYIKPQPWITSFVLTIVVSYRNSTSNHNCAGGWPHARGLYLIEILHQTTTCPVVTLRVEMLYLIEILHQTTTTALPSTANISCILSKFYIKPQLVAYEFYDVVGCILSKFYIKPQQD